MNKRIYSLVVDDKKSARDSMAITLERLGHDVDQASTVKEALACLEKTAYDLVLTDMQMPVTKGEQTQHLAGIQVVDAARRHSSHVAIVVMTAYGSIENSVEAMKRGANDYVTKPISIDEIRIKVEKALNDLSLKKENLRLFEENLNLRGQLQKRYEFSNIIGVSDSMKKVLSLVGRAAQFPDTVLIQGESGTGKELISRAIHYNSPRKSGPFIPDNCGAIPETLQISHFFGHERGAFTDAKERREGRFEQATGGTLFLDEIGDMSKAAQAILLRVLETGQFERVGGTEIVKTDVRVVAATNKNLLAEIDKGCFREDLFARLDVIRIWIPPLRERSDDIPVLAKHFCSQLAAERGLGPIEISSSAMEMLKNYSWPRNVRELRNLVKRSLVFVDDNKILPEHIQFSDLEPKQRLSIGSAKKTLRESSINGSPPGFAGEAPRV